jgi:hypothetical protein
MQWKARTLGLGAVFTGLCTAAGLAGAVPPARADLSAQLTFLCAGSAGTTKVKAAVIAPGSLEGRAGEQVGMGKIALSLAVPVAMLPDRTGDRPGEAPVTAAPGRPTVNVGGAARLAVTVTQNGRSTDAAWSDVAFDASSALAVEDGTVNLGGTATAPSLVPAEAGDLVWTVRGLTLALSTGTGEEPRQVTCAPEGDGVIGRLPVKEGAAPAPGARNSLPANGLSAAAAPEVNPECEVIPAPDGKTWGFNQDPRLKLWGADGEPGGAYPSYVITPGSDPDELEARPADVGAFCIRASGFTDIKKLHASSPLGAETLLRRGVEYVTFKSRPPVPSTNYIQHRSYSMVKEARSVSTALGFGFMPTLAATSVRQVKPPGSGPDGRVVGNFRNDLGSNGSLPTPDWLPNDVAWSRSFVQVKVNDVQVNGTPLRMGESCQTAPTVLFLKSDLGSITRGGVDVSEGSTFTGTVNIPQFSGCGVGEDLSPLLSAAISGGGNTVKVDAGKWCAATRDPSDCTSETEPPAETYTIKPGGRWVVESKQFTIPGSVPTSSIVCDSFSIGFDLPKAHWTGRLHIASTSDIRLSGCELRTAAGAEPVTVTNNGPLTLSIDGIVGDAVSLEMAGLNLEVERGGQKGCLKMGLEAVYIDRSGPRPVRKNAEVPAKVTYFVPKDGGAAETAIRLYTFDSSACTDVPGFDPASPRQLILSPTFTFSPKQTFVRAW